MVCEATQHRFAKFDDATIYCRRCGERRVMVALLLEPLKPAYVSDWITTTATVPNTGVPSSWITNTVSSIKLDT